MDLTYHIVDVFTTVPFEGNPLAVFPDATGLETRTMQRIAREFNLSETVFILPQESRDGGTRVRIFTPFAEMEFAGHPTIGTAFMMRQLGIVSPAATNMTLDENVGPVKVRVGEGGDPLLWLTTPPIRTMRTASRESCAAALSLQTSDLLDVPCELLSAGNPTLLVALKDAQTVDRAVVDMQALGALMAGWEIPAVVFVFAPVESGAYSRMFAPHHGVIEDPATGSSTGPLAAFMMKHDLAGRGDGTTFVSEQGTKMGRRSLLHVSIHGDDGSAGIEVGGNARHIAKGALDVAICS